MPDRSFVGGLLAGKCPHCRAGNMFVYGPTNLLRFNIMHERCPHCNIRLEPEPGFYQGAMYVSYGFTVMMMLLVSAILYYFAGHPSEWVYITVFIAVMIFLIPFNYRYSRIVFLYLFGGLKYDPRESK